MQEAVLALARRELQRAIAPYVRGSRGTDQSTALSPEMACATLVKHGKRRVRVGSRYISSKAHPTEPGPRIQSRKRTVNGLDHGNDFLRSGSVHGDPCGLI